MSRRLFLYLLLPLLILILVSCGGADDDGDGSSNNSASPVPPTATPIYVQVSHASLQPGDEIPAPRDEVILTVSGKIGASNVEDAVDNTVQFNIITLESLGVVKYQTFDEFGTGADTLFEGVLLDSLLKIVGIQQNSTEIEVIARDGFSVTIPLTDRAYPVLLALKAGDIYLTPSQHGPVRLVYPYGYFELDPQVYDVRWVWSIDQIVVR